MFIITFRQDEEFSKSFVALKFKGKYKGIHAFVLTLFREVLVIVLDNPN